MCLQCAYNFQNNFVPLSANFKIDELWQRFFFELKGLKV